MCDGITECHESPVPERWCIPRINALKDGEYWCIGRLLGDLGNVILRDAGVRASRHEVVFISSHKISCDLDCDKIVILAPTARAETPKLTKPVAGMGLSSR